MFFFWQYSLPNIFATLHLSCVRSSHIADGQWSLWTTWGVCSQTCGTGGIRSRQRNCDNPTPTAGGKYCIGRPFEIQQCAGLNDPHVIQSAQNFTKPAGSQVVLPCLVLGSTEQAQTPNIIWTAPMVSGHPFPKNLAQLHNGALYIEGMTVDNVGPYCCTVITACGTYDSPKFWVFIA